MKLSKTMLNFLGYLAEDEGRFCEKRHAIGMAWPWGIKSALKNGLIREETFTFEFPKELPPIPGCPYGESYEGYTLTERGQQVGNIGLQMRDTLDGDDNVFVAKAQQLLDTLLKEVA